MPRIPREGQEPEDDKTTEPPADKAPRTSRARKAPEPDPVAETPPTEVVEAAREETDPAVLKSGRPSVADRDAAAAASRVSVINESHQGASEEEEEYKWHTGAQRPHGAED